LLLKFVFSVVYKFILVTLFSISTPQAEFLQDCPDISEDRHDTIYIKASKIQTNERLSRKKIKGLFMENNKQATGSNIQDGRALSRRDFLAKTILIGAGLAVGPLLLAACSEQPKEIANTSNKGLDSGTNKMKTRKLGKLEVSELGAGCMSISANYGPRGQKPGDSGHSCSP
jgi:hypothetical protein